MRNALIFFSFLFGSIFLLRDQLSFAAPEQNFSLPEFTQKTPPFWINSPPIKRADLKGKVILIDVWAFDCWNCYRSFPWLNHLEKKYSSKEFQVIGIHTPEFEHEKNGSLSLTRPMNSSSSTLL